MTVQQDATPDATAFLVFKRNESLVGVIWLQMTPDEWRELTGTLPSPLTLYREFSGAWVIEWRWTDVS